MAVTLAVAFLLLSGKQSTSQSARSAVRLIDLVKPGMTLSRIKKVLPKGTRYGKPHWFLDSDREHGNAVILSSKAKGTLVFRRASQLKQMEATPYSEKIDKTLRASDPIVEVYADLEDWKSYSKSRGRACLDRVIRVLGKPKSVDFDPEFINTGGGWFAAFVRHGREVLYFESGWRDVKTGKWSYSFGLQSEFARRPFSKG